MPRPNKTAATKADVNTFIDDQPSEAVRDDCRALMKLMRELTGAEPYMYGPSIVGFGSYHYRYASGHEGDAPLLAFSPRKPELVIYVNPEAMLPDRLAKLGKHRATKSCVYVKRLADIDAKALKALLKASVALTRKAWPK
jgi:hypothetical protein